MKPFKTQYTAAIIAFIGVTLSTVLLVTHMTGETTYVIILSLTSLMSLAIYLSPRLREINLKEMKLILEQWEKAKAEIDSMYGDVTSIKGAQPKFGEEWNERLGANGGLVTSISAMNYVSGCIRRERERLAEIFSLGNTPEKTALAILDHSKDDFVFKWESGTVALNVAPRSVEERTKNAGKSQ